VASEMGTIPVSNKIISNLHSAMSDEMNEQFFSMVLPANSEPRPLIHLRNNF
jgi:hypothetical protein